MSTSKERRDDKNNNLDSIRSEGEGFNLQEIEPEHLLLLFLGRVYRKFQGELNAKHIEDVVPKIVSEMTEGEREIFNRDIKDSLGTDISHSLNIHLKDFLGEEDWEKLETLERNRILEHDRHESEGVG